MRDSKENCPHCGKCLQGKEIPEKSQKAYGATHFSLMIAVYDRELDRVTKWECPFCKKQWDREWGK